MNNLTAIEKLIQTIEYYNITIDCPNLFKAMCDQALENEKEQILNAYKAAYWGDVLKFETSEEYFNKTFKK